MTPLDIHFDQGRAYFGLFNAENDSSFPSPKPYKYAWLGRLLYVFLGWTTRLKAQDGKIYYFDKQDLDNWIDLHKGSDEGSYFERIADICKEQVLNFRQEKALGKLKKTWNEIRSKHLKEKAEERIHHYVKYFRVHAKDRIEARRKQKELDQKECLKNDTFKIIMGDQTIIANPNRMRTSHYFRHFLDYKEKDQRVVNMHLDLMEGQVSEIKKVPNYLRPPYARPTAFKKTEKGDIECVHVQQDPNTYILDEIVIDEDTFDIVKRYLEGKTEKKADEKNQDPTIPTPQVQSKETQVQPEKKDKTEEALPDDSQPHLDDDEVLDIDLLDQPESAPKPVIAKNKPVPAPQVEVKKPVIEKKEELDGQKDIAHLITPYHFEGLYKFHNLFDISGIMEIAYDTIDFYSEEKLTWKGKSVSAREFWTSLAKTYGDQTLQRLCDEKYKQAILIEKAIDKHDKVCQANLHHLDYHATISAPIQTTYNSDGTLNIVLKLAYDGNYISQFDPNYYKKRLEFFTQLSSKELEKAKVAKIIVNVSGISNHFKNYNNNNNSNLYLYSLMDTLQQHLNVSSPAYELVFQGANRHFFENQLDANEQVFTQALKALSTKFFRICFDNIDSSDLTYQAGYFQPVVNVEKKLFQLFDLKDLQVDTSYVFKNLSSFNFSVALQQAEYSSKKVTIQYQQDNFDLQRFDWLPRSIDLTLHQTGPKKEPLKAVNLSKLPVKSLTIQNAKLMPDFAREVNKAKSSFDLRLKECDIDAACQKELQPFVMPDTATEEETLTSLECVQAAIELSNKECQESSVLNALSAKTCQFKCEINDDNTANLVLNVSRDLSYMRKKLWDKDYYMQRLAGAVRIFLALEEEKLPLSSIVLDVSALVKDLEEFVYVGANAKSKTYSNFGVDYKIYLNYLLRDIQEHLIIPALNKLDFTFKGLPDSFWDDFKTAPKKADLEQQKWIETLKGLLQTHTHVNFQNIKMKDQASLELLLKHLKIDGHVIEVSFSSGVSSTLSLSLKKTAQANAGMRFVVNCNQEMFDAEDFRWIKAPIQLIFRYPELQNFNIANLNRLQVEELTIENAILDQEFISQIQYGTTSLDQLDYLTSLTLRQCQIETNIQQQIDTSFMWRNAVRETGEVERQVIID